MFNTICFFVSCVCLHNKNQKVFISRRGEKERSIKSRNEQRKRFFAIRLCHISRGSPREDEKKRIHCTRQTSPRRFARLALFFFVCVPLQASQMVVIFPNLRKQRRREGKRMFRRLLWRIPFVKLFFCSTSKIVLRLRQATSASS